MKLRVTTVGNSTGVILPKELLEKLRISKAELARWIESKAVKSK